MAGEQGQNNLRLFWRRRLQFWELDTAFLLCSFLALRASKTCWKRFYLIQYVTKPEAPSSVSTSASDLAPPLVEASLPPSTGPPSTVGGEVVGGAEGFILIYKYKVRNLYKNIKLTFY
jgi:hypothetical protein